MQVVRAAWFWRSNQDSLRKKKAARWNSVDVRQWKGNRSELSGRPCRISVGRCGTDRNSSSSFSLVRRKKHEVKLKQEPWMIMDSPMINGAQENPMICVQHSCPPEFLFSYFSTAADRKRKWYFEDFYLFHENIYICCSGNACLLFRVGVDTETVWDSPWASDRVAYVDRFPFRSLVYMDLFSIFKII